MFFYFFPNEAADLPSEPAPDLTMAGVGRRLAECRRERGLQQKALAERSNVAPSAISRFENGAARPSLESICRLAHALGVSVDFLVGRTDVQLAHRKIGMEFARRARESGKAAVVDLLRELTEALDRMDGSDWAGTDPEPAGSAA